MRCFNFFHGTHNLASLYKGGGWAERRPWNLQMAEGAEDCFFFFFSFSFFSPLTRTECLHFMWRIRGE